MRPGLMRSRGLGLIGLGLALALAVVWLSGGMAWVAHSASAAQRVVQEAMAISLRAIRAGDPGAVAALLALCFGYGFVHAAGPGHGKFLIGSYGVARRVAFWPLAGVAVVASLAQAAVAIVLVQVAFWLLGWTRAQVLGAAEGAVVTLSHVLVLGIGGWLVWRGIRGLSRPTPDHAHHPHDHGPDCGCGHSHGPTAQDIDRLTGWRDGLVLVAGVAIRPCSGALLLLVLTAQMGLSAIGMAGAVAMGLGVACVTVLVAALAVWAREGAFAALPDRARLLAPMIEAATGAAIMLVAASLLWA